MIQTPRLIALLLLHNKAIVHENKIYRVYVDRKKVEKQIVSKKATVWDKLWGHEDEHELVEEEDAHEIWLIDGTGSTKQKVFPVNLFIAKVLGLDPSQVLPPYRIHDKLAQFTSLRYDFHRYYNMTIKDEFIKIKNL